jgi:lactose/L-arabinose transport system ATP-binding protein
MALQLNPCPKETCNGFSFTDKTGLYNDPDNRFVAGFIGSPAMNFVSGVVDGPGQVTTKGLSHSVATGVALPEKGAEVTVGLRPQHLKIGEGATHRVELTEALGGVAYVHLTAPSGEKLIVERHDQVNLEAAVAELQSKLSASVR